VSELLEIAVFLGVGLVSGAVFFGALDRLHARITKGVGPSTAPRAKRHATLYLVATLLLRIVLVGALLIASVRTGIHCLLAAFVGVLIARALCLRFLPIPASEEEEE
jgi:hypothetical protein